MPPERLRVAAPAAGPLPFEIDEARAGAALEPPSKQCGSGRTKRETVAPSAFVELPCGPQPTPPENGPGCCVGVPERRAGVPRHRSGDWSYGEAMTPRRDDLPDLSRRRVLGGMALLPLLPLAMRLGGEDEPIETTEDEGWNEPVRCTGSAALYS